MSTVIVDGNNVARMAFGQAGLMYNGRRTEIVKIGLAMIRSYLEEFNPDVAMVCWDGGRDSHRTLLFPEYKKKKKDLTQAEVLEKAVFFEQLGCLRGALHGLGLAQYRCLHREADDVIYTIIKQSRRDIGELGETVVISTDMDMFQLFSVAECLRIYSPIKKTSINKESAEDMFGFPMDYFMMYKAITGDASDNLPGIHGIGPVGAKKIIKSFVDEKFVISPSDRVLKLFMEKQEDYDKMLDLVSMIEIPRREIADGRTENQLGATTLFQNAIDIYKEFGFEVGGLGKFIAPFDRYVRLRNRGGWPEEAA
jgi:DNA polymerase-1